MHINNAIAVALTLGVISVRSGPLHELLGWLEVASLGRSLLEVVLTEVVDGACSTFKVGVRCRLEVQAHSTRVRVWLYNIGGS